MPAEFEHVDKPAPSIDQADAILRQFCSSAVEARVGGTFETFQPPVLNSAGAPDAADPQAQLRAAGLRYRALVEKIPPDQLDVGQQLADPAHPGIGLAPDQAPDLVSLRQQVFSQVGAVLAGDTGDQSAFRHGLPVIMTAVGSAPGPPCPHSD